MAAFGMKWGYKPFSASLDGNTRRDIDLREDDELDEAAFQDLVRAAAQLNEN